MNKNLVAPFLVSLSILTTWQLSGQEAPPSVQLEQSQSKSPDRYSLSFRMGFNITANFSGVGSFPAQGHLVAIPGQGLQPEPANPSGARSGNRTYEDGYVWVDSSGNAFGYTRYWGYDNNSQYNPVDGTIAMHSSSSSGTDSNGRDGDPQPGFELTYNRALGTNHNWRWGVEAAFNYMNVTIHDGQPLAGRGALISDVFQLPPAVGGGFIIPNSVPYYGPYYPTGHDPVLNASPSGHDVTSFPTSITGSRDFDANVFGWRFGPYAELPLGDKASLSFSAGLSLAAITSDFAFKETITFDEGIGAGTVTRNNGGSGSSADLLVGGYVSGALNVVISKNWGAFGGVQFQDLGHYTHREGPSQARLDLTESVFLSIGATYSF